MSDFAREFSRVTARSADRDVQLLLQTMDNVLTQFAMLRRYVMEGGYSPRCKAHVSMLERNARELCGEARRLVEQLSHRTREVLDAMNKEAEDDVRW